MKTKAFLATTSVVMMSVIGSPIVAAHAKSATLAFTGIGYVCTWDGDKCVDNVAFKGTVTFDVRADGPSGADAYGDGRTVAWDRDGSWVESHFFIEWGNHRFKPGALPHKAITVQEAIVHNDYDNGDGIARSDGLFVQEAYQSALDESPAESYYFSDAFFGRHTPDSSWLSPPGDLSFDLAAGRAPGDCSFPSNSNVIAFSKYVKVRDASTGEMHRSGFYGVISHVSLTAGGLAGIDIKPTSKSNNINPAKQGVLLVAVLGSRDFDATQVDSSTVCFGRAKASPVRDSRVVNVNHDGYPDMLFSFSREDTGIECGDKSAWLSGKTFGGEEFAGADSIRTVGCKKSEE